MLSALYLILRIKAKLKRFKIQLHAYVQRFGISQMQLPGKQASREKLAGMVGSKKLVLFGLLWTLMRVGTRGQEKWGGGGGGKSMGDERREGRKWDSQNGRNQKKL